jgi:hypothetical protein
MTVQDIYSALHGLLQTCELRGESGTEKLMHTLEQALESSCWRERVETSHEEGLGYDHCAVLAGEIRKVLLEKEQAR